MGPGLAEVLIALLIAQQVGCIAGVQNDTNASALTGINGTHNKGKVVFAYVAFAVGGTLMFVGFIYLIVWALTAKDGQDSPELKPKGHGIYMDQDIAGRKTAPENVGGGEDMKYDPDTYLPIITVSDVPGADNAYVNANDTGHRIQQESKSDGDAHHNKNLLQVTEKPRRHSAEDPIVKTKRHSTEYGKKRHSLESQSGKNGLAEHNEVTLIAADRRSSIGSGRHSPTRRGRRQSDISTGSVTSQRSSLHDELSRRRTSNISISEVEPTSVGEDDNENRHSPHSRYRPYDSPKYRRASLNVENLHKIESTTETIRLKDSNIHFVASGASASNSQRSSRRQSDTTSEDSSGAPRKKSWLYDRFGIKSSKNQKKKGKGRDDKGKTSEDNQSTDDGYSTIEGTTDKKDKPSLTKYNKKDTDYKSVGLLAVPLIANARNVDSFQQSGTSAAEYVNQQEAQDDITNEDKSPGNFQLRSAGPANVYVDRESYQSDRHSSEFKQIPQEQPASFADSKSSGLANYSSTYNNVEQADQDGNNENLEEARPTPRQSQNLEDEGVHERQSEAESYLEPASDSKRHSTATSAGTRNTYIESQEYQDTATLERQSGSDGTRNTYIESQEYQDTTTLERQSGSDGTRNSYIESQEYQDTATLERQSGSDGNRNSNIEAQEYQDTATLERQSGSDGTRNTYIESQEYQDTATLERQSGSDETRNTYIDSQEYQDTTTLERQSGSESYLAPVHQSNRSSIAIANESNRDSIAVVSNSNRNSLELASSKRNSIANISTLSSDGGPVMMSYDVQEGQVDGGSKRSSLRDADEDAESVSATPVPIRHSINNAGEQIERRDESTTVRSMGRPTSISSQTGSVHSADNQTIQSTNDNSRDVEDHVVTSQPTQSHPDDKSASRSNSHESEGSYSYETAPSDTDSQRYVKGTAHRYSYNSGDSYISGSALESNHASMQQSVSGSMHNRLSASSEASQNANRLGKDHVENIVPAYSKPVSSQVVNEDLDLENKTNSQVSESPSQEQQGLGALQSPPVRPDSPVPLERATSMEEETPDESSLETTETYQNAQRSTPPPAPPPPTFFIPPPPPLPSMSFAKKPSASDLTAKVTKRGASPSRSDGSSPMPFMEELTLRLQKYSDPKVNHGTAAVNVTRVLDDRVMSVKQRISNFETVAKKETEPLVYGVTNGLQSNDVRDGNNSSLSNESEMSIPQAVESGTDTGPASPEVLEDAGSIVQDQNITAEASDTLDPMDKQVAFRESVSHIPSPASSFAVSESQIASFENRRLEYPKEKYPNLVKSSLHDDLEVSSNHPDDVSLASEQDAPTNDSFTQHQGSVDQSQPITTSGGNGTQPAAIKKEDVESGLPQQEDLEYPSDHVSVPMEDSNDYRF